MCARVPRLTNGNVSAGAAALNAGRMLRTSTSSVPCGPVFVSVLQKAEVLQEPRESLLPARVLEHGHVDLIDGLAERVVEDDLEEALAELEAVDLNFERADLQPAQWQKSGLDVTIVLLRPLDLEVQKCDGGRAFVAHVHGLVRLARKPAVENRPAIVRTEGVEKLCVDIDLAENGLLDREDLVIDEGRVLRINLLQERVKREHAVRDSEDCPLGVHATVLGDKNVHSVREHLVHDDRIVPVVFG